MNITIITENFLPRVGGADLLMSQIATFASEMGHHVRVVTLAYGDAPLSEHRGDLSIYRHRWPTVFGHPIPQTKDLEEHIKWADLVHTTTYSTASKSQHLAHKHGKPCVITVYELLGEKWFWVTNPFMAFLLKAYEHHVVRRGYTLWHSISEATKKDLIVAGVSPAKIVTIYPGVDVGLANYPRRSLGELWPSADNRRVFLFFGRVGQTKGWDILLQAIRQIQSQLPDMYRFGFLVNSPETICQVAGKLGVSNLALVHKNVSKQDLAGYIKSSVGVIVPSVTEGFGFSAAEACALGAPIIASDAGSLPEVVGGRYLIFENRSVDDLAHKIMMATNDQYLHKITPRFEWERSATRIINFYGMATHANHA